MTLTIKLDGNWSSFQLANSAPPLSVTGSATAPSARLDQAGKREAAKFPDRKYVFSRSLLAHGQGALGGAARSRCSMAELWWLGGPISQVGPVP